MKSKQSTRLQERRTFAKPIFAYNIAELKQGKYEPVDAILLQHRLHFIYTVVDYTSFLGFSTFLIEGCQWA